VRPYPASISCAQVEVESATAQRVQSSIVSGAVVLGGSTVYAALRSGRTVRAREDFIVGILHVVVMLSTGTVLNEAWGEHGGKRNHFISALHSCAWLQLSQALVIYSITCPTALTLGTNTGILVCTRRSNGAKKIPLNLRADYVLRLQDASFRGGSRPALPEEEVGNLEGRTGKMDSAPGIPTCPRKSQTFISICGILRIEVTALCR
jgi:hypothetical protein